MNVPVHKPVCSYILDSQRSEERKQHAEDARPESNLYHKERDRKRKLTALPVKVSLALLKPLSLSSTSLSVSSSLTRINLFFLSEDTCLLSDL